MSDKLGGGELEGSCWPGLSESELRLENWQRKGLLAGRGNSFFESRWIT